MNCRRVSHSLSAYMDGELQGVEHRLIHDHLGHCGECHAEYEGLLRTKRLVSRMRLHEPRPELPQAIWQRLRTETKPASDLLQSGIFERLAQNFRTLNPARRNLAFGTALTAAAIFFAAHVDSSDDIEWTPAPSSTIALNSALTSPDNPLTGSSISNVAYMGPETAGMPAVPSVSENNMTPAVQMTPAPTHPGRGQKALLLRPGIQEVGYQP